MSIDSFRFVEFSKKKWKKIYEKSAKKIFFEKKWTILLVLLVVFVTTIGFVSVIMFQNK